MTNDELHEMHAVMVCPKCLYQINGRCQRSVGEQGEDDVGNSEHGRRNLCVHAVARIGMEQLPETDVLRCNLFTEMPKEPKKTRRRKAKTDERQEASA